MEITGLGGHVQVRDEFQRPVDVALLPCQNDLPACRVGEHGEPEDRTSGDLGEVGEMGGDEFGGSFRYLHRL